MTQRSKIFEEHYKAYIEQIASVDLLSVKDRLGFQVENQAAQIPFFGQIYQVSGQGIFSAQNERADYVTCVILSKYILLCPDQTYRDEEWCTFRDFKKESHFTNINIFNTGTTGRIKSHFSGRMANLKTACEKTGGVVEKMDLNSDLCVSFKALPRLSLLLLMNDADEDFPADCRVLFQKQGEHYLDPESLVMTSGILAAKLIRTDEKTKEL